MVLCPRTSEGLTGSGSGFKESQKTGPQLKGAGKYIQLKRVNINVGGSAVCDCGIS